MMRRTEHAERHAGRGLTRAELPVGRTAAARSARKLRAARKRQSPALTLIELLVVIAITSMMILAINQIFSSTTKAVGS